VRSDRLRAFTEHIDSFAHGTLPIAGWAHVPRRAGDPPPRVRIYRNGEWIGTATINLGRQDVFEAMPEVGSADKGWRYDLDFRHLPPGMHRIDLLLETGPGSLVRLGTRHVGVMEWTQAPPRPVPQQPLPAHGKADASLRGHVDLPVDYSSYYYNPLVPLWHAYRGQQVVDYLGFIAAAVRRSCLADTDLYTHQINPFSNPGWDENKYAVDASLQKVPGLVLGVSLYGESTYGESFFERLRTSRHTAYGVTEFHPLRPMDADSVDRMLDVHANHGARFISFFLEPRWQGKLMVRNHNLFSLDPANPRYGSAPLYRAIQERLAR
jgi:hypothetical protein